MTCFVKFIFLVSEILVSINLIIIRLFNFQKWPCPSYGAVSDRQSAFKPISFKVKI